MKLNLGSSAPLEMPFLMISFSQNVFRTPKNQTMDYSPWFSARKWKFLLWRKMISSERESQEEQNGADFSFIAPSSEEL